ncbi:MAG: signal peptidase II [Bacteroidales bacterium]
MKRFRSIAILVLLIVFIDQCLKVYVKLHFRIGEELSFFGNWALVHFLENDGMAFGWSFGGKSGKLILNLLRIAVSSSIFFLLYKSIKQNRSSVFTFSLALIFAGALGNLIDVCFYGILFSESSSDQIAKTIIEAKPYASFLHGKVVDMLHFPILIIEQEKMPVLIQKMFFWSNHRIVFFRSVFNLADFALIAGLFINIVFNLNKLKRLKVRY